MKPRSYVRAAAPAEGEPTERDLDSLQKQVTTFFNSKGISDRQAHFLSKIQSMRTINCKVFIELNGPPEEAKVLVIKERAELGKYKG